MGPEFDVLSYGTIGIDSVMDIPHLPRPDLKTHVAGETDHLGGKATNTAAHLANWGVRVAVSGNVIGGDRVGDLLFEILARQPNISTRYLERRAGVRSMFCRIMVTPDGERTIIGVNVDHVPQTSPTAAMVGTARLLTLDLYGGAERVEAARLAAQEAIPVIVGDVHDADHPVLPFTTVAICSAAEVRLCHPDVALEDFVRVLLGEGPSAVVITDGPHEVQAFRADLSGIVVMPPHVPVVDTTGAGDAFRAGFVYGHLAGWPLDACTAMGAAAGSLNVGRRGAASEPYPLDEVLAQAEALVRRVIP